MTYKPLYKANETWNKGDLKVNFYEEGLKEAKDKEKELAAKRKIIKPEDMPWDICRQGRLKHVINEKMDARITTLDVYIQEIPSGSRSGKHRHMSEELFYVLEGKGYDMHWDPDVIIDETKYTWAIKEEGKKFEWEEGDLVYVPVMVAHQHFNADPAKPARIIVANTRLVKHMGCPTYEQLEDAPDYKPQK